METVEVFCKANYCTNTDVPSAPPPLRTGNACKMNSGTVRLCQKLALTWAEKYAILEYCKIMGITGGVGKIRTVQSCAKSTLNLSKEPSYKSVMKILKTESIVTNWKHSKNHGRKKLWNNVGNELDDMLRAWIEIMWERGVFLTDAVITEKARRIQRVLNLSRPLHQHTSCNFSNGWLYAFKKRHGFRSYRSHGESGDADVAGADAPLPRLRQLASQYPLNDVFNADEFGLAYTTSPNRTVGPGPLPGKKAAKERLAFLVCTNVDSTERVPPLMIGKSNRPRCFNGASAADLGLDYENGAKAWMTTPIFVRWLHRFDAMISQTRGRKALLFIDNCSAHGTAITLPLLQNTCVEFLPKNTTSILQPLDLGVIRSLKARYKALMIRELLIYWTVGITRTFTASMCV